MSAKSGIDVEGNEERIWRKLNEEGPCWTPEEARRIARLVAGHARGLGNLFKNGYIERRDGRYCRTEKGLRHFDRTVTKGQAAQRAERRSRPT